MSNEQTNINVYENHFKTKHDLKSCNCIICDFKMQTYLNTYCGFIDIVGIKLRKNQSKRHSKRGNFQQKKKIVDQRPSFECIKMATDKKISLWPLV